jgi:hypothetical protein
VNLFVSARQGMTLASSDSAGSRQSVLENDGAMVQLKRFNANGTKRGYPEETASPFSKGNVG